MRLAIVVIICFVASAAVNSSHRNHSAANEVENLGGITNAIVDLPPINFSLNGVLRRGEPAWCKKLKDQTAEEVMANCQKLKTKDGYVLRIDRNVNEETWKRFIENAIEIGTNVEIVDSLLTEVIMTLEFLLSERISISNNLKLEKIVIKPNKGSELDIYPSILEIKENPMLKSIKIEANNYYGNNLTISENEQLETIELNVPKWQFLTKYVSAVSNNPSLRRILINCNQLTILGSLHIVGNRMLAEFNFLEITQDFAISNLLITDNDKLGRIKFPEGKEGFSVDKLKIQKNDKLRTIDVGEKTRWKNTQLTVCENSALSCDDLKILRTIGNNTDIQEDGVNYPPTTAQPTTRLTTTTFNVPSTTKETTTAVEMLGITTDLKLIDTPLPGVIITVKYSKDNVMIIKNNQKLETIVIKPVEGSKLYMGSLEIKGNPVLKSIRIEAETYNVGGLTISDNSKLETIAFNVAEFESEYDSDDWTISNNPKLRLIQIQNCNRIMITGIVHIVGNEAFTHLDFPETMELFAFAGIHINDNDNMETIKIPRAQPFFVGKIEIRKNDKLKTIDLGEQTRWTDSQLIARENPALSFETLEALKKIKWKTIDIQDVGEGEFTTTTTATTTITTTTTTRPVGSHQNPKEIGDTTENNNAIHNGLIIIGVVVVLIVVCVGLGIFLWKRKSKKKKEKLARKRVFEKEKREAQNLRREESPKTKSKESPKGPESTSDKSL